jgi:hypothetical protein
MARSIVGSRRIFSWSHLLFLLLRLLLLQAFLLAYTAAAAAAASSSSSTNHHHLFAGSTASFLTTQPGASSIRRDRKESRLRMSPPHDDTAEADAKAYNAIASSSVDITDAYIRNGILTGEERHDFCLYACVHVCCLHFIDGVYSNFGLFIISFSDTIGS